jgi:hypothetical protein
VYILLRQRQSKMKLTEKEVMKIFNKHKKMLIQLVGTKSTTDTQLNTIGNKLFGRQYLGTFSQDNFPWQKVRTDSFAIINTDTQGKAGVHWVAVYATAKTIYIWDSYGRNSKQLLPIFTKQVLTRKLKFKDSDPDADQSKKSQICGQICMAWMLTVKQLGIANALKV